MQGHDQTDNGGRELEPLSLPYGWGRVNGAWHFFADRNWPACHFATDDKRRTYGLPPGRDRLEHDGPLYEAPPEGAETCPLCKHEGTFDTAWVDFPTCPWCGYEDQDWWEDPELQNDGDTTLIECGQCGEQYRTTLSVETRFDSEKVAEDDKGGS
jgi:hypothetical protein